MKIKVKNFRGCSSADFDLDKIVLICGDNYQGKTSIAQSMACALNGRPIPIDKMTKKLIGRLVHGGTSSGSVMVANDEENFVKINYPEAEISSTGTPPYSSGHAIGFKSLLFLDRQKRVEVLNDTLKALPSCDDLKKELEKNNCSIEIVQKIWQTIEAQGWDSAHAMAKEKGTKLKGAWESITGERYGARKASAWMPPAWSSDLSDITEEKLNETLTAERGWLETAIAHNAVSEEKQERLSIQAKNLDSFTKESKALYEKMKIVEAEMVGINHKIGETKINQQFFHTCPSCGDHLIINNGVLEKFKETPAGEIKKAELELKKLYEEHTSATSRREIISKKYMAVNAELLIAKKASDELAEIVKKSDSIGDNPDAVNVEDCRKRIVIAEDRLKAFSDFHNTQKYIKSISTNDIIIKILAPGGLRKTKLFNALEKFNNELEDLCSGAGWKTVELTEDMDILYNGNHVGNTPELSLCSGSEWKMSFIALQMMIAQYDSSDCIVIDGADVFDKKAMGGLLTAVSKQNIKTVIFMKMAENDFVKTRLKLEKNNIPAYWIKDGKLGK